MFILKYAKVFFSPDSAEQSGYELKLKTRKEHILAKLSGDSSAKSISPKTRDEYLLLKFEDKDGTGEEK